MSAIPQKIDVRPMPSPSHDTILEQAIAGSSQAFENLIRTHQGMVRSFLSRYAGCPETADDLAQEVFVVAYQRLSDFRHQAKFSTWLLGIARNKALNYLRGEMRRRKHEQRFFDCELAQQQYLRLNSEELDSGEELIADLKECLDQLPERSGQLVDAYYFQKQSALSIASELQQKSGAVRMKLLRIRAVLQKCIAEKVQQRSGMSGK